MRAGWVPQALWSRQYAGSGPGAGGRYHVFINTGSGFCWLNAVSCLSMGRLHNALLHGPISYGALQCSTTTQTKHVLIAVNTGLSPLPMMQLVSAH